MTLTKVVARKRQPRAWILLLVLVGCSQTETASPVVSPQATTPSAIPLARQNLLDARAGFKTTPVPNDYKPDGPAPIPPKNVFELVKYPSEVGELSAYVTPDPKDSRQHPAVIWAHGGFGGIGSWLWDSASYNNDQTAAAFRKAGIVLMCPSWRGENDNPGDFELFYGEVNDLLAAREYLAKLRYVNARRIYVAGHSTGGTLTLLAATATDKFRAAFSFGGAPDVGRVVSDGVGYGNTPFDPKSPQEARLRSAIHFAHAIKTPTYYFEGEDSTYVEEALEMEHRAQAAGRPFTTCIIRGADHFDILAPLTEYVAKQILSDNRSECRISITASQANEAFVRHAAQRAEALANKPVLELTDEAYRQIKAIARTHSIDLSTYCVRFQRDETGRWSMSFDRPDSVKDTILKHKELGIVIARDHVPRVRGHLVEFYESGAVEGLRGFIFTDQFKE